MNVTAIRPITIQEPAREKREVRNALLERDEFTVQDEAGGQIAELGHQLRHVPAAPAPHAQPVHRGDERTEAIPLHS